MNIVLSRTPTDFEVSNILLLIGLILQLYIKLRFFDIGRPRRNVLKEYISMLR